MADGTYSLDLDVNGLGRGMHTLNVRIVAANGEVVSSRNSFFYKGVAEGIGIAGYEYWVNGKYGDRVKVPLAQAVDNLSLVTELQLPAVAFNPAKFAFDFEDDQPYVYNENVFRISFYNTDFVSVQDTAVYIDMSSRMMVAGEEIKQGDTFTKPRPSAHEILWHRVAASAGDSISIKANGACTMQVFSPDGTELYKAEGDGATSYGGCRAANAGTYYVALHSVADDEAAEVTISYASFVAEAPTFVFKNGKLGIACADEGASIYYRIEGRGDAWTLYTDSLTLTDNRIVYAIATREGLYDSEEAVFTPNTFTVAAPVLAFDDPWLTIDCDTEDAAIRYIIDGVEAVYTEPVRIDEPCTVAAFAEKEWLNNSDTIIYNVSQCEAPVIAFDGQSMSISCATEGAEVYYTLDDSEPNMLSARYTEPVALSHNTKVRAVAYKQGALHSGVTEYVVDVFKTAAPVFAYDGEGKLAVTCATEGAAVYYRLQNEAKFRAYVEELTLTDNRTVYACAKAEHMHDSDTLSFTPSNFKCEAVEIEFSEPWLSVSCGTEDAIVRYTIDGVEAVYTEPVRIDEPCMVMAFAAKEWFNNSDTIIYNVERCESPVIAFDGEALSISCATDGAVVRYRINETMDEEAVYREPVAIAHNFTVTAYAERGGMLASRESVLVIDTFTVAMPAIAFDDPWLTIGCATEGAVIHYTLDGTEPTAESPVYEGSVELYESCEVRAFAMREYMNDSEAASLDVKIEAPPVDEYELVTEDVGGYVAVAVDGMLDEEGLRTVVELNPLYIDFSRAEVETLPDGAFEKCTNLAAVTWFEAKEVNKTRGVNETREVNDARDVKVNTLGCANPNLLFYCTDKSLAPSDARNVIVGGKAESIALRDLTDEEALLTRGNFYCPEPFEAKRIGYEHTYGMKTGRGSSEGWETLALPFDVQSVYNKTKRTDAVPFGKYDKAAVGSSGPKPFWLYEFDGDAFVPASAIHANWPYIVSMPNNDAYLAEFNIPGNVEFSAEDATVAKTKLPSTPQRHDDMFIATMTHRQATDNVYAINKYESIDGYNEGSVFVRALRDIRPFEAYFHSADTRQKVIRISDVSGGKADGIEDVGADAETEATNTHALYNLQGQRVDRNYRGIVITNGRKVLVNE